MKTGGKFGLAGLALRFAGCFIFALATVPLGSSWFPDMGFMPTLPFIPWLVACILVLNVHAYLAYRAYYALDLAGLALSTFLYLLMAVYVLHAFNASLTFSGATYWTVVGYLSLIYTYGLSYNHIDVRLSGLVHNKNV